MNIKNSNLLCALIILSLVAACSNTTEQKKEQEVSISKDKGAVQLNPTEERQQNGMRKVPAETLKMIEEENAILRQKKNQGATSSTIEKEPEVPMSKRFKF